MDGDGGRSRLGDLLLGGIVGGLAGLAASRLRAPRAPRRSSQPGLRAFEGAPCFRELLEDERDREPPQRPAP